MGTHIDAVCKWYLIAQVRAFKQIKFEFVKAELYTCASVILTMIGLDNGSSHVLCQAIIYTQTDGLLWLLLTEYMGINPSGN